MQDAGVLQGPVTQHLNRGEEDAKIGRDVDHEALAQAHVNVITGACMAIGIKVRDSHPSPHGSQLTVMLLVSIT